MPALNARPTDRRPTLDEGLVHVWHADLAAAHINPVGMLDLLDADECARALRLRNATDRAQFVASHGVARTLLACYLGCDPRALRFGYEPRGKPYLVRNEGEPDLRFNVSRTMDFALFAVADGREVGIDIEQIVHDRGLAEVALRALTHRERARLDTLELEIERTTQFFRAWTRKEAFLKARGDGLAGEPGDVDTEDDSGKVYVQGRLQPDWRVHDLAVRCGYSAAVAAAGENWCVISSEVNCLNKATTI